MCWQISSLSREPVRYSHQRDFEVPCKDLQKIKVIALSLLVLHELEKRSKIDGLEAQLVEDFGKVGQTVAIESGLSKGFHARFGETSRKWQSPMHTDRHCLGKWNEYSPVSSLNKDGCDLTRMIN